MTALALFLLLAAGPAFGELQTIDVVYLKDGTTLQGLIIEQEAGVSVKLASADGIVWTLEDGEIDLIDKEPSPHPLAVQYTDVVMLKDGVLFRGTVVEQRPGESVDLRTSAGALLRIPVDDVWAFVKRKQVAGVASAAAPAVDKELEPLRIRLQIQLASRQLATTGGPASAGAGGSRAGGSGSTLEEEIDTLEQERDNADYRARDEERDSERQAIETLDKDISDLLDKLLADLQECGRQGGVGQAGSAPLLVVYQPSFVAEAATAADIASRYTSLLGGMVDATLDRIPTDEVVAALDRRAKDSRSLQRLLRGPSQLPRRLELDRIRPLVARLPVEERQRLYHMNKSKDAQKTALLNLIPFTFAGSWSAGDALTGGIGFGMLAASFFIDYVMFSINASPTVVQTASGWEYLRIDPATWNFWLAPACYAATYAFGFIMPPLRANAWNTALAKALDVDKVPRQKPATARAGPPPVALVPGSHGEPRLEVRMLSLRY
jgi:hypothetical protein